jgi:hypothetical protein
MWELPCHFIPPIFGTFLTKSLIEGTFGVERAFLAYLPFSHHLFSVKSA